MRRECVSVRDERAKVGKVRVGSAGAGGGKERKGASHHPSQPLPSQPSSPTTGKGVLDGKQQATLAINDYRVVPVDS